MRIDRRRSRCRTSRKPPRRRPVPRPSWQLFTSGTSISASFAKSLSSLLQMRKPFQVWPVVPSQVQSMAGAERPCVHCWEVIPGVFDWRREARAAKHGTFGTYRRPGKVLCAGFVKPQEGALQHTTASASRGVLIQVSVGGGRALTGRVGSRAVGVDRLPSSSTGRCAVWSGKDMVQEAQVHDPGRQRPDGLQLLQRRGGVLVELRPGRGLRLRLVEPCLCVFRCCREAGGEHPRAGDSRTQPRSVLVGLYGLEGSQQAAAQAGAGVAAKKA